MTKVTIFGAAGRTGRLITKKMLETPGVEATAFVRDPAKFGEMDISALNVVQGDALVADDVRRAMDGQEVLLCSLDGDVLTMAKNIVAALPGTGVRRIVWVTGMGIHGEIKGLRGVMLKQLARRMPEYIEAAETILASPASATLLRCGTINDGQSREYELTRMGEQPRGSGTSRAAIAQFMADVVADEALGAGESLGICN